MSKFKKFFQKNKKNNFFFIKKLCYIFWPSIGWKRFFIYLYHKVARMSGSPHYIACGVAWGAAISMTPFMGFHLILSIALSCITGGGVVPAVIGTLVGNPWTFPFIFELTYRIGNRLIGLHKTNLSLLDHMLHSGSFIDMLDRFWQICVPMSLGAIVIMPLIWVCFYFMVKIFIIRYRIKRKRR